MVKFQILEKEAVADVAFEAFGKTASELFENSALALFEQMANTKRVLGKKKIRVAFQDADIERLLYGFLSDIVFRKDTERTVFSAAKLKVAKKDGVWTLTGQIAGQKVDELAGSVLRTDVKAVTFYGFKVEKTKAGFKAKIVLDI